MAQGRIIVVDDEENIRSTLHEILSDEGYEVSCAADGETALRTLKSEAADLVLLDVWMPGIDGMQTLKILKDIDPETEVVMMSGHGAIETAVKATKFGAFDFIEKPFSLDSILRTVAKALKSRRARMAKGHTPALGDTIILDRRLRGSSKIAKKIHQMILNLAISDTAAVICGESGIGKKFVARLIHNISGRREKPFIEISCDGSKEISFINSLLDVKGSKASRPIAKFDLSKGGTVFFDKIDGLPPKLLEKLFLQVKKGRFSLSGERKRGDINVRFMASISFAGNGDKNHKTSIAKLKKLFDGNVVELAPLRNRKEDIPDFIEQFVDQFSDEYGKHIESVSKEALKALVKAPWPGNVRQLKNLIGQAVMACDGPTLKKRHLPPGGPDGASGMAGANLDDATGARIEDLPLTKRSHHKKRVSRKKGATQKTLKNSVVLVGQGLHSGIKTGMILSPLPPGSGIIFGDISTGHLVPALLENVRNTDYATTLSDGHVAIKTIEHILSAVHSYGITNLLIKIGDEAPIMDGSALDFCQLIENSGIEEQNEAIEEIVIDKKLSVGDPDEGPYLSVEPAGTFSIHYFLDYPPPIGKQEHKYVFKSSDHYKQSIAPARTFAFVKDIKKLEEAGLGGGGKLSNIILIDGEKVVNTPLRFPDEPARHKILDIIGDLYLLGRPIKGRFKARKSGHTQNIEIVRKILDHYSDQSKDTTKRHAATG